jgi:hypothetical protein
VLAVEQARACTSALQHGSEHNPAVLVRGPELLYATLSQLHFVISLYGKFVHAGTWTGM